MATPKKPPNLRPDAGADKASPQSRLDRVSNVRANAKDSSIYKDQPQVQVAYQQIDLSGTKLGEALAKFTNIEQAYILARETFLSALHQFDNDYDVYAALVTKFAHTLEEVAGLGMVAQTRTRHALEIPTTVAVKVDKKGRVGLTVKGAQKSGACIVEISTDDKTWTRLEGTGVKYLLEGYAPGSYWVHAANSRSGKQSAFCEAVPFTIKP